MKRIRINDTDRAEVLRSLYERPLCPAEIEKNVSVIVDRVRNEGDAAICEFLKKFDGVEFTPADFLVSEAEFAEAEAQMEE